MVSLNPSRLPGCLPTLWAPKLCSYCSSVVSAILFAHGPALSVAPSAASAVASVALSVDGLVLSAVSAGPFEPVPSADSVVASVVLAVDGPVPGTAFAAAQALAKSAAEVAVPAANEAGAPGGIEAEELSESEAGAPGGIEAEELSESEAGAPGGIGVAEPDAAQVACNLALARGRPGWSSVGLGWDLL